MIIGGGTGGGHRGTVPPPLEPARGGAPAAKCPPLNEEKLLSIFQTEAERRRREAGVHQSIENGLGSCMYVYTYVCMVLANIWRFKAPSESKVVPYDSHVNSTLLRHEIIEMWWVPDERVARDLSFHSFNIW